MSGLPESYYNYAPCAQQTPVYNYFNTLPTTSAAYYNNYDYTYTSRTNQGFYTDHLDTSMNNWMADIEKHLKVTDKIETLEITSKDLSPASCCSNIEPPHYYNFPSCSQVNNSFVQEYDYSNISEQFYSQPFVDINQAADCSGESDIVVEDSEGCFSDDSRDSNRFGVSNCIVCNIPYMPLGSQFYTLTTKTPLTMSSQSPVYLKLVEILGRSLHNCKTRHLCSDCLGLLNTIDHLRLQLETTKSKLLNKFRKTCLDKSVTAPITNRRKFRSFCGVHYFSCKVCKKKLTAKTLFMKHLSQHQVGKHFLCERCGRRFKSARSLNMHVLSHQQTIPAFVCRQCDKPFRTKSNLKEHYRYCTDTYPYECCDKKFATVSKLKHHRKLKHDKKFVAICSICNVGFVKLSAYKAHKVTHSTEKKYNCVQCGKSYKTISNLNFHMKVHRLNLPFICTICNKGFMRKEYLEAHVNKHNGIKDYTCQVCSKKFVSQKNLDAHLKYHDGSVKKHTCNICNKVVTTGFDDHLRTHSNLKEFQCDLCVMKFNTKSALSKHKTKKHP